MATAAGTKSTELSPIAKRIKALVTTKKDVKVADVLRAAQTSAEVAKRKAAEVVSRNTLPVPEGNLALTSDQQGVIDKYVNLAGNAPALPSSPRELEQPELDKLVQRFIVIKTLEGMLSAQLKGIRGAVLNHLTLRGERLGDINEETPRDKNGWALVGQKFTVEGESEKLSVEPRSGEATITAEDLQALEDEGVISHRDMLEATNHVRVVNEAGFFTLLRRKPELADYLASRATYKAPSISLYKR